MPASISNLGPGFDSLAVAVQLYLQVRVVDVRPSAPDTLETRFVDCSLVGDNRIEAAFRYARAQSTRSLPGLTIEVRSDIPQRAGLGSSAAATVAGLRLFEIVSASGETTDWLPAAARLETHPDNAAAALLGGLTASCQHDDGRVTAHTWRWPEALTLVVATPDLQLDTHYARSVLPASVGLRDAVFNLQRALLLVHALETARYDHLREAMRDRWHQPFRAPLVPGLAEAIALEHPSLVGASLAGAGPSVVALALGAGHDVAAALGELYARLGVRCTIRILSAHQPDREHVSRAHA